MQEKRTQEKERNIREKLKQNKKKQQVKTPSPSIPPAPCQYFGRCGGCSQQDILYEEQVKKKQELLKRITTTQNSTPQIYTASPWNYRNRMDFVCTKEGLGLKGKKGWNDAITIEHCPIAKEEINQYAKQVNTFFKEEFKTQAFDSETRKGTYRYVVIRTPQGDASISFVINKESKKLDEAREKIKLFAQQTTAPNIILTKVVPNKEVSVSSEFEVLKGTEMLMTQYNKTTLFFPVQGFFQVNDTLAQEMHTYCKSIIQKYREKQKEQGSKLHLLDLYGGVGAFGFMNRDKNAETTILEIDKECIKAAKKNKEKLSESKQRSNTNITIIHADATTLKKIKLQKPLFIIVDPPRAGLDSAVKSALLRLKPEGIVYISCNPKQLATDILTFTTNQRYTVESAALFDFFPHTEHFESIIELKRTA